LAHEQSVIQLRGQRLATSVSLIKSLGAGRDIEAQPGKK
jgi:outer membrane protein TolC